MSSLEGEGCKESLGWFPNLYHLLLIVYPGFHRQGFNKKNWWNFPLKGGGQQWVDFPLRKINKNNISLKHLKSSKKHFKTNSFFHPPNLFISIFYLFSTNGGGEEGKISGKFHFFKYFFLTLPMEHLKPKNSMKYESFPDMLYPLFFLNYIFAQVVLHAFSGMT